MTDNITPKKHCMIVHAYYPLGETRVEREALALIDAGYQVDVLCLRDEGEEVFQTIDGIDVYRLPVKRRSTGGFFGQMLEYLQFFILVVFKLLRLYPQKRYATIQAHNLPDFLVFSALIPKIAGARLILDIHDIMPEFMAARTGKSMNSLPVRLTKFQEQLSCRFADQVITVTDLWKERLIERGTPEHKIGVVMNLADERIFKPLPNSQRPPRSDRFTLIYHGTFKRHYGLDVLIRAISIARKDILDLKLVLQGVGEFVSEMVSMVKDLNLEENVQINDFVLPTADLPGLIYQADLGVVPNHDDLFTGELLPTKMLEYAALGVPVIAAKTKVISSYFDDKMVRFFTPGDARNLTKAIVDAFHQRDQLPEQARQLARFTGRYNWTSMANRYVELVQRLSPTYERNSVVEQA